MELIGSSLLCAIEFTVYNLNNARSLFRRHQQILAEIEGKIMISN